MPSHAAAIAPSPIPDKVARAQALALDILCRTMQQTQPGDDGAPIPTRDARLAAAAVLRLPKHLLHTDPTDVPAHSALPEAAPHPSPPPSSATPKPATPAPHSRPATSTLSDPLLTHTPQPLRRTTNKPAPAAALLARAGAAPTTTPTSRAPPEAA